MVASGWIAAVYDRSDVAESAYEFGQCEFEFRSNPRCYSALPMTGALRGVAQGKSPSESA